MQQLSKAALATTGWHVTIVTIVTHETIKRGLRIMHRYFHCALQAFKLLRMLSWLLKAAH
jgi:hypothetical protein